MPLKYLGLERKVAVIADDDRHAACSKRVVNAAGGGRVSSEVKAVL